MALTFMNSLIIMSLRASIVIFMVILLAFALSRFPKRIMVYVWIIVIFRLLCPFRIESSLSMFSLISQPSVLNTGTEVTMGNSGQTVQSGDLAGEKSAELTNPYDGTDYIKPDHTALIPVKKDSVLPYLLMGLWLAGIAVIAGIDIYCAQQLKKRIVKSKHLAENVYLSPDVRIPFTTGIFRHLIYLPEKLTDNKSELIISHELSHVRYGDQWLKLVGYLGLLIHWFNPLVWVAYALLSKDIEMACDERTVCYLGNKNRVEYAELLYLFSNKEREPLLKLSFGGNDVKKRISRVLHYQKPGRWVIMFSVILLLGFAVFLGTDHAEKGASENKSSASYGRADLEEDDVQKLLKRYAAHDYDGAMAIINSYSQNDSNKQEGGSFLTFQMIEDYLNSHDAYIHFYDEDKENSNQPFGVRDRRNDVSLTGVIVVHDEKHDIWIVTVGGYWKNDNYLGTESKPLLFRRRIKIGGSDAVGISLTKQADVEFEPFPIGCSAFVHDGNENYQDLKNPTINSNRDFLFEFEDHISRSNLFSDFSYMGYGFSAQAVYGSEFSKYNWKAESYYLHTWNQGVRVSTDKQEELFSTWEPAAEGFEMKKASSAF